MALTQEQLDAIVRYATEQITQVIEETNIYDEKNTQRMYLAIQQIYDELGAVSTEQIPEMLQSAYVDGLQHAIEQLGRLGIGMLTSNETIGDITQAPLHVEAISNIISDTLSDLKAAYRTANNYSIKHVQNAIDDVKQEIANGMIVGMTDKQIAQRVGNKFSEKGMTAFVTKDGKHLPLDFYANTVVKTKIQTATNHAHLNRYADLEVGYVTVTGNVPTCHECARYRDIVFSTKPGDPDFPYINLFTTFPKHPHCSCNFKPYIKKFKSDEQLQKDKDRAKQFDPNKDPRTENEKKRYDAEQKAKQKARQKRLAFNRMQAKLGKDGPQSFNEFKKASKWQYHKWVAQMNKFKVRKSTLNDKKDVTINSKEDNGSKENMEKELYNYSSTVWDKQLSQNEKQSINAYTTNVGKLINLALLNDDDILPEIQEHIDNIQSAINKFDLQNDLLAFRGLSKLEFDMIDVGEQITKSFLQFKSTTLSNDVAKDFSSMSAIDSGQDPFDNRRYGLIVNVPKGANGAYIKHLSDAPNENEFLLNKGVSYKVIGKYKVENWNYIEIEVFTNE
ncbi:capsid protein [Staphylococcus haemolyticus]|uniref:phage minor capsid protein n=1 Tax=Staphylococcus haemolyticus TaxID=1283 RepID=UPI002DB615A8|nr:phage minor capsid protein [Staphylococcus haemolyticus]MEB5827124.1 capsid protein [Staphylococcus haemolyticus]